MDISDLKRAEETRAATARERELFGQQLATESAKTNENPSASGMPRSAGLGARIG
jgi:hypothetical protein